jgi:hypothetical protein
MAPLPTLSPRRGTGKVNRAGRGIKGEGSYNFHEVRRSEPSDLSLGGHIPNSLRAPTGAEEIMGEGTLCRP